MRVILGFIVLIGSFFPLLGLASQADIGREKPLSAASTLYQLSWDNGIAASCWTYYLGPDHYVAVSYGTPPAAAGNFYLQSIKYAIRTNWPDSIFQGFGIACWKMTSGEPGNIVWPANGSFPSIIILAIFLFRQELNISGYSRMLIQIYA